ncbi:DUF6402 family protein [Lysobacter arvi]|uniref:DUF6402 family protein n=1 Tax=Lysobacter arvi TaxID=3038776 RepID=A0ABU1CG97_9GAMM|nr:DUF6402 family protein [Lysobacter arvi]MDR0183969.1 DUF6402 family protein [Lysobacter arvi]
MSLNDFSNTNALESNALFVLPEARSVMSPVSKREPKRVPTQRLEITQIPRAMRNMGWVTSARLIERWFSTPAWSMPGGVKSGDFDKRNLPFSHFDDTIITMKWAMRFPRFQEALAKVGRTSFHTPNGLEQLRSRLGGWRGTEPVQLGYYGMPTRSFDASCWVNSTVLGSKIDTLDDMYGALGIANVKVGVVGTAVVENKRKMFHVAHVGFYVLDYYDFVDWQYLGTWTKDRVLTKAEALFAETYTGRRIVNYKDGAFAKVFNQDFREYRDRTGRGGDFVVYSDVLWQQSNAVIDLGPVA